MVAAAPLGMAGAAARGRQPVLLTHGSELVLGGGRTNAEATVAAAAAATTAAPSHALPLRRPIGLVRRSLRGVAVAVAGRSLALDGWDVVLLLLAAQPPMIPNRSSAKPPPPRPSCLLMGGVVGSGLEMSRVRWG